MDINNYNNDEIDAGSQRRQRRGSIYVVEWKKYTQYNIPVDSKQNDKATEIAICDFSRPHMRAFHCSWWSFFIAFFSWFALTPILTDNKVRIHLNLTKKDIWDSTIASFAGTIIVRLLLGPLCDKYGARILFSIVLCITAIPTALTGLISNATELIILRLFIGLAGGSFVMCQYWASTMFANEIVGTANALVAGWGNLGAGITQLIVGTVLFPLFKLIFNNNTNLAWRTVCIIPAIISFISGVVVYYISDDTPKGNYNELRKNNKNTPLPNDNINVIKTFCKVCCDMNTWILFIQYGCCFGVELTMNSAAVMYFRDEFGLSTETATAVASIFGWMNLFARGFGGFLSDIANHYYNKKTGNTTNGMFGRLLIHFILLLCEGFLVLIFGTSTTILGSIVTMLFFSFFVQASEGSTYGIVPYVLSSSNSNNNSNNKKMGTVMGIVGAGGNVGAVIFAILFKELHSYKTSFQIMGTCILISAILTIFINIKGHTGLIPYYSCCGSNKNKNRNSTTRRKSENNDVEIGKLITTSAMINNFNNNDNDNSNSNNKRVTMSDNSSSSSNKSSCYYYRDDIDDRNNNERGLLPQPTSQDNDQEVKTARLSGGGQRGSIHY